MEPPLDWFGRVQKFLKIMPSKVAEYEGLLSGQSHLDGLATEGCRGYLSPDDAIALGVTGPPLRASPALTGICGATCPTRATRSTHSRYRSRTEGDVWARYVIRHGRDVRIQSRSASRRWIACLQGRIVADAPKIILPDREQMKTQMESLIHHFKIVTEGFGVPAGEVFQAVESPRGVMGYYVVSGRHSQAAARATCATQATPRCRRLR